MFADKLFTPHQSLTDYPSTTRLYDSDQFRAIKHELANSPNTYEDIVDNAYAAAGIIRRSLRFAPDSNLRPELTPENLIKDGVTNCHGYSLVTSESFSELGIDHYIAVANQHSFIVLHDEATGRLNIVDTPIRSLYTDITDALPPIDSDDINRSTGAAYMLDGQAVLEASSFTDKQAAKLQYPWLSFTSENNGQDRYRYASESSIRQADNVVMRIYPAESGRQTILAYTKFNHAMAVNDYLGAHALLGSMDGLYPDIDRRNQLKIPTELVRSLASNSFLLEAISDLEIINNSITPYTDDLALHLWAPDKLRSIGYQVGSRDIINSSRYRYYQVLSRMREKHARQSQTEMVDSRLKKSSHQIADLNARIVDPPRLSTASLMTN